MVYWLEQSILKVRNINFVDTLMQYSWFIRGRGITKRSENRILKQYQSNDYTYKDFILKSVHIDFKLGKVK